MLNKLNLYKNKKILVTGNTGFKGPWLALFLKAIGSNVIGYSNKILWKNGIFNKHNINSLKQYWGDIRNFNSIHKVIDNEKPDLVFHLAAQPLVSESYNKPYNTFNTNVNGTLNLLEIISKYYSDIPMIIITSDKVYKNNNENRSYTEQDELLGSCPYSTSKAVCEMISKSYFDINKKLTLRTVRAGNVIGGGDWSKNRIIPDLIKSYILKKDVIIRSPNSIRPWSYVLDIIYGYLLVGIDSLEKKYSYDSFNLAPIKKSDTTVLELSKRFIKKFGTKNLVILKDLSKFQEKNILKLSSNKSLSKLGWVNFIDLNEGLELTSSWYKKVLSGHDPFNLTNQNIKNYIQIMKNKEKLYA